MTLRSWQRSSRPQDPHTPDRAALGTRTRMSHANHVTRSTAESLSASKVNAGRAKLSRHGKEKMLPDVWLLLLGLIQIFPQAECSDTRDDIIQTYFSCGYSYNLIICFLYFVHGISIFLRQLKRILRRLYL